MIDSFVLLGRRRFCTDVDAGPDSIGVRIATHLAVFFPIHNVYLVFLCAKRDIVLRVPVDGVLVDPAVCPAAVAHVRARLDELHELF